jgi:predicted nuclease of predicted toxin-antitoxin system
MTFLIDAQLPPALAGWLREAGHDAVHVEDLGLRDANDGAIWQHALQTGAAIISWNCRINWRDY